ncbi:unnamed protein product [Closterium sp. NIES-54]
MRSNGPHDGALTPRLKSSPRGSSRPRDAATVTTDVSSRSSTSSSAVVIDDRGGSSNSSLITIGGSGDSSLSVSVRPSAGLAGVTRHASEASVELQVREGGDDIRPGIDGVTRSADEDRFRERERGEREEWGERGEEDVRPAIELPEKHGLVFGERHTVGLSERHGSSAYSSARETDSEIDEASDGGRGRAGERRAGRVRERRVERSKSGDGIGAQNWLAAADGAAGAAASGGSVTGGAMTGAGGGSVKASVGWGGVRVRVWCDPRSLWPVARVLALLLLWYTFSTALSLYNKMLIGQQHGRFPAPLLLTAFHFAQQALMASALLHSAFPSALPPLPLSSRDYCLRVIPTAVATAVDIALSNQSLAYITLTFYTMCKSSAPMFLLLFAFIFRLEPISFRLIGVMMVISVGVLFTVAGEASFHLWGFVLVMLSAMASGLRWVLIQVLLQKDRLGLSRPLVSLAYLTPPMAVTCGLFSLALEPLASLPTSPYFSPPSQLAPTMLLLLLGGVLAFLMIMSEFLLILHTSAVTFSVAGTVKEGATILVSHLVFSDRFTRVNLVGVLIIMIGVSLFNLHRLSRPPRIQRGAAPLTPTTPSAAITSTSVPTTPNASPLHQPQSHHQPYLHPPPLWSSSSSATRLPSRSPRSHPPSLHLSSPPSAASSAPRPSAAAPASVSTSSSAISSPDSSTINSINSSTNSSTNSHNNNNRSSTGGSGSRGESSAVGVNSPVLRVVCEEERKEEEGQEAQPLLLDGSSDHIRS